MIKYMTVYIVHATILLYKTTFFSFEMQIKLISWSRVRKDLLKDFDIFCLAYHIQFHFNSIHCESVSHNCL